MDLVKRTIARYVRLTDEDWSRIGTCWTEHAFSKGALISKVGEVEQRFYIVKSGVQRLSFPHDGEDICVGFSYDGSWSGAFDSFVTRKPSRFDVRAVTDSVLYQRLFDLVGNYLASATAPGEHAARAPLAHPAS